MSETEQSWSFAGTRSVLKRGRLLICAMARVKPGEHWPMCNRDFAVAVDRQTAKGNPVAAGIRVYTASTGRCAPEFDEMLHMAMSACLIEYLAPSFMHMVLSVGPGTLPHLTQDMQPADMKHADALAQEFWDVTYGAESAA